MRLRDPAEGGDEFGIEPVVTFSTVGPKNRSTSRSAALRPPALRGFSGGRARERSGGGTWGRCPSDAELRFRVVRSTLQYAKSARGDAIRRAPLTGRECPSMCAEGSRTVRPQGPPHVHKGHRTCDKAFSYTRAQRLGACQTL